MKNTIKTTTITKTLLALLPLALSVPAHAWVPKLEEQSAKTVIDSAYGRRTAAPTYLTIDLNVKDGKFVAPDGTVKVFDGGDQCLSDWLSKPTDFSQTSRPTSITLSGQANQLLYQAQDARNNFKNLTVKDALAKTDGRLPDGQLRVAIVVRGLSDLVQRDAYDVVLKVPNGQPLAATRKSFVTDWTEEGGKHTGTLAYYFEPLKAGLNASDKVELLLRTEADSNCAYSFTLDLSKFN